MGNIKIGILSFGLSFVPYLSYHTWKSFKGRENIDNIYIEILKQKSFNENNKLLNNIETSN